MAELSAEELERMRWIVTDTRIRDHVTSIENLRKLLAAYDSLKERNAELEAGIATANAWNDGMKEAYAQSRTPHIAAVSVSAATAKGL